MEFVMDFLLLAASGTACLYCLVLSRRLKGLANVKGGLGAGVAALSKSAEEMRAAVDCTKKSADTAVSRLESLLAKADQKAARLNELMDQLADMSASVVNHADGATKKYVDGLAPFISEANAAAESLLKVIDRASTLEKTPMKASKSSIKKSVISKISDLDESDDEFVIIGDAAIKSSANRRRARSGATA